MDQNGAVVGPLYLFELASSQARYLELRQSTIATNVATQAYAMNLARQKPPGNVRRSVEALMYRP